VLNAWGEAEGMLLTLKMADYENARNYDTSFYEWVGNDEVSV